MSDGSSAAGLAVWHVPQCPFAIEYSPGVLEQVRIAVTDAFYSVPHGGAEIGGVLFGVREPGRIRVLHCEPLPCEHAFGPSFVLSERDHRRLAVIVSAPPRSMAPVGWYHSHTRSDITLSGADLEIHDLYFPQAWQIALILRPHALEPMRAGFFFRDVLGKIRAEASYAEFVVEAPGKRVVHAAAAAAAAGHAIVPVLQPPPVPEPPVHAAPVPKPAIQPPPETAPLEAVPPEAAPPEALPAAVEIAIPRFLAIEPPRRRSKKWLWIALAFALPGGIAAGAWYSQPFWMPYLESLHVPAPPALTTRDHEGQLEIQWDPAAGAVRNAASAVLYIADGDFRSETPLDGARLRTARIFYIRRTERVDVRIDLRLPGGSHIQAATTFMGRLPQAVPSPAELQLRQERDALANELRNQGARTRHLEQTILEIQNQLRRGQESRPPESQLPARQ